MLSNACQYAIRSILYLGIHSDETNKIGAKKIAEELETPHHFLAKLLQQLTANNIVSSSKGPHGGFYLNKKNKQKSVWNIIETMDGADKFSQCFLGLSKCDDKNPCPVHSIVAPFKKRILKEFRDKTIDQLVADIKRTGTVLSLKDFNVLDTSIKKNE